MVERNLSVVQLGDQSFHYIVDGIGNLPKVITEEDAIALQLGLVRFMQEKRRLTQFNSLETEERKRRADQVGVILDAYFSKDLPDGDILDMFNEDVNRTIGMERLFRMSNSIERPSS